MKIVEKTFLYTSSVCLLWLVGHDIIAHSYDATMLGSVCISSGIFALAGAWIEL